MGKSGILNVIIAIGLFAIFFLLIFKLIKIIRKKIIKTILRQVNIDKIDALSGFEFEEYLYYLFCDLGFKVTRTKATRDYGADLVIDINNIKITIQCKLYCGHNVGTNAIQEAFTSIRYYNANTSIVITNSYFTKSAKVLADKTNLILIDRDNLIKMIKLKEKEKYIMRNKLVYKVININ